MMSLARLFDAGGVERAPEVVAPARAARFVGALEAAEPRRYAFSTAFEAYSVGRILDQERDLGAYFAAARTYGETLAAAGDAALPEVVLERMRAWGAPIVIPSHPRYGPYAASTLRCLPTDGIIPPHCETEQLEGPQYGHLRGLVDAAEVLSWFVVLQAPEGGGELCRYQVARGSALGEAIYRDRMRAGELLADQPHELHPPVVGELVVFAGGRAFHEVRPVQGRTARWTLGGFLCRARGGGYLAFS